MANLGRLLRNIFRKQHVEQELDEEIQFYEDSLTQERVEAGASEEQARRAVRLTVGSVTSLKESVRDVRTGAMLERVSQDFRYAIRSLRNNPGFTAAAVLVLALGIGANSAVFSLVNAFLLKPLTVDRPEELVSVYSRDSKHPDSYRAFSYPNYADMRDSSPVFSSLAAHNLALVGVQEGDTTRRAFADIVSTNFFSTLGVSLLKGRPFSAQEEKPGGELTVIVAYSFWKKIGQDPRILGQKLRINGHLFTVIGITRKGFTGTTALISPEMFVPLGAYNLVMNDFMSHGKPLALRDNNTLLLVGRLKPGVTPQAANAQLAVVASRMEKAFPAENKNQALIVGPLSRLSVLASPPDYIDALRAIFVLLMSMASVVLLIACLNLANMLMAKGAARRKEIAIRLAIGGSRRRILQQLTTEGVVLAVLGAAAGLVAASWSTKLLIGSFGRLTPFDIVYDAAPDMRVLATTLGFCTLSVIIFALFPAWKLSKPDTWSDLKETAGADVDGRCRRLFSRGNLLVMAQLSLSLMLLTAAGLFVHSALRAAKVQPGFSIDNQLLAEVDASLTDYDEAHARQLYSQLRERLKGIPGVESVAMAATVPFAEHRLATSVAPSNVTSSKEHPPLEARFNIVTNDYFRTLSIPLLRGRPFAAGENTPAANSHVAILNRTAADKLFPKGDAIGKQIRLDEGSEQRICEVVGVAGDIRSRVFGGPPGPEVYIPFGQQYQADMQIHLKIAATGPDAEPRMLKAIRREMRTTDGRLPLLALKTMRGHLESGAEVWLVRAGAHLFESFGASSAIAGHDRLIRSERLYGGAADARDRHQNGNRRRCFVDPAYDFASRLCG